MGLSGIGSKTVSCSNSNCSGIKVAELTGFIEKLSTNLSRKPKIDINKLINYLENNKTSIDTKSKSFLKIIKDNGTKVLSNTLLTKMCGKDKDLYHNLSNICFEKATLARKSIEVLYNKGVLNNFEDFFKLSEDSFKDDTNQFIEGFGKSKINHILHQIETIKKGNSDTDLMAALNIPNVATSTSTTIFQTIPLKELLQLDLKVDDIYNNYR